MLSLPRELDLICAQAVPWRLRAEGSLGGSSYESLGPVPQPCSLFFCTCCLFISGEVDVWEVTAAFLLQLWVCRPECAPPRGTRGHLISCCCHFCIH